MKRSNLPLPQQVPELSQPNSGPTSPTRDGILAPVRSASHETMLKQRSNEAEIPYRRDSFSGISDTEGDVHTPSLPEDRRLENTVGLLGHLNFGSSSDSGKVVAVATAAQQIVEPPEITRTRTPLDPVNSSSSAAVPTQPRTSALHAALADMEELPSPHTPTFARLSSAPAGISPPPLSSTAIHSGPGDKHNYQAPPIDYIDPSDGHIWRAKYCVLKDGVLYFYRNAEEGNSTEAQVEREQMSPFQHEQNQQQTSHKRTRQEEFEDLSKSPMPRRHIINSHQNSSFSCDGNVIWEKRVSLDHVGEVRSAELEYGKKAFELLAIGSEDNPNSVDEGDDGRPDNDADRLILRASSKEEMDEWLFQFHRSLESYMKKIFNMVGSNISGVGDLHFPSNTYEGYPGAKLVPPRSHQKGRGGSSAPIPIARSPGLPIGAGREDMGGRGETYQIMQSYSPSAQLTAIFGEGSLSHGHGRNGAHRRRVRKFSSDSTGLFPETTHTDASTSQAKKDFDVASLSGSSEGIGISPPRAIRKGITELVHVEWKESELNEPIPSVSAGKYIPPHMRKKRVDTPETKYVPPHSRSKEGIQLHMRAQNASDDANSLAGGIFELAIEGLESPSGIGTELSNHADEMGIGSMERSVERREQQHFILGGCADPTMAIASIEDEMYVPKKASRIGKFPTAGHGGFGGGSPSFKEGGANTSNCLQWEVGAISVCGIRDSNEDSYLISHDLSAAFDDWDVAQPLGLFAIFDGHCGNHAARYAAERLPSLMYDEYKRMPSEKVLDTHKFAKEMLTGAIQRLDEQFCLLCQSHGREWESGATAVVTLIIGNIITFANLGDSRGVMCMTTSSIGDKGNAFRNDNYEDGWSSLNDNDHPDEESPIVFWKEVTDAHIPSREDERRRIEDANGWVTTETEIPIAQLHLMDFHDKDVVEILRRYFLDRFGNDAASNAHNPGKIGSAEPARLLHISRVCGDLAVSRAIGDRDFKAAFNLPETSDSSESGWKCPLHLPYPDNHSHRFEGDLVIGTPEIKFLQAGTSSHADEFLLLACDGLWDVMDADDAVRVARGLLLEKGWSAQKAAARLAELAEHLGSSDNITVIVIRFLVGKTKM